MNKNDQVIISIFLLLPLMLPSSCIDNSYFKVRAQRLLYLKRQLTFFWRLKETLYQTRKYKGATCFRKQ